MYVKMCSRIISNLQRVRMCNIKATSHLQQGALGLVARLLLHRFSDPAVQTIRLVSLGGWTTCTDVFPYLCLWCCLDSDWLLRQSSVLFPGRLEGAVPPSLHSGPGLLVFHCACPVVFNNHDCYQLRPKVLRPLRWLSGPHSLRSCPQGGVAS